MSDAPTDFPGRPEVAPRSGHGDGRPGFLVKSEARLVFFSADPEAHIKALKPHKLCDLMEELEALESLNLFQRHLYAMASRETIWRWKEGLASRN